MAWIMKMDVWGSGPPIYAAADAGAPVMLTQAGEVARHGDAAMPEEWRGRPQFITNPPVVALLPQDVPEGLQWRKVPPRGSPEMLALLKEMLDGADIPACLGGIAALGRDETEAAIVHGRAALAADLRLDAMMAVAMRGAAPCLARELGLTGARLSTLVAMCDIEGRPQDAAELRAMDSSFPHPPPGAAAEAALSALASRMLPG
jgi:hypothetical protein